MKPSCSRFASPSVYAAAGYAPDAANAAKLARRADIKARVRELQDEAVAFSNVRRERVIVEIDRVASANIADFIETVEVEGKRVNRLLPLGSLPRELAAAVQSNEIDPATGHVQRIKLHDKMAAMATLLRYLGGLLEAPAALSFSVFDDLTADEQRSLADLVEAIIRDRDHARAPDQPPRGQHLH